MQDVIKGMAITGIGVSVVCRRKLLKTLLCNGGEIARELRVLSKDHRSSCHECVNKWFLSHFSGSVKCVWICTGNRFIFVMFDGLLCLLPAWKFCFSRGAVCFYLFRVFLVLVFRPMYLTALNSEWLSNLFTNFIFENK